MRKFFTKTAGQSIFQWLSRNYGLDPRALSLMRMAIGMVLILDILIRLTDLKAHYTADGVLPLSALFQYYWNSWHFSFHAATDNYFLQLTVFLIQLAFAFFLFAGFKTRVSTLISWILLLSLHNRNPIILQGGDDLLRMMLFWGMFLPWERHYSLDVRFGHQPTATNQKIFSLGTLGFMIQIFLLYFFSALLKTSNEWTTDNTALYYALSLDQMVLPIGKLIYPYPDLLKALTFIVYRLELWIPLLFIFPVFNSYLRGIAVVAFTIFHLAISTTLFVGLFFIIGIVTLTGLYPKSWMEWIHRRFSSSFELIIDCCEWILKPLFNNGDGFNLSHISQRLKVPNFVRELSIGLILIYIIAWNFSTVSFAPFSFTEKTRVPADILRINQNWGMFAPGVFKDDGWYIFEAITFKNQKIDLNRNGIPVDYNKPELGVSLFRNDRWRKYSENFLFISNQRIRPFYCNFILKEWNQRNPEKRVRSVKIIYMKERTKPDYLPVKPIPQVLAETYENQ